MMLLDKLFEMALGLFDLSMDLLTLGWWSRYQGEKHIHWRVRGEK